MVDKYLDVAVVNLVACYRGARLIWQNFRYIDCLYARSCMLDYICIWVK